MSYHVSYNKNIKVFTRIKPTLRSYDKDMLNGLYDKDLYL